MHISKVGKTVSTQSFPLAENFYKYSFFFRQKCNMFDGIKCIGLYHQIKTDCQKVLAPVTNIKNHRAEVLTLRLIHPDSASF